MKYTQLSLQLKVTLATVFSFYLKSHNFHWNIKGPDFIQYHKFLEDVYTNVWESVDAYAEHIRSLDEMTPASLSQFSAITKIEDATNLPDALTMITTLANDNEVVLQELYKAHDIAVADKKYGVVNFLEGQIDYHDKLHWMLNAFKA